MKKLKPGILVGGLLVISMLPCFAQDDDIFEPLSAEDSIALFKYTRTSVAFQLSIAQGFEIFSAEKANPTIATTLGLNLKNYNKNNPLNFFQAGLGITPTIILDSSFTSFAKVNVGYGFARAFATYSVNAVYYQSFLSFGNMWGAEYGISMHGVPLTLSHLYNSKFGTSYFLVSVSFPFGAILTRKKSLDLKKLKAY